MKILYFRTSLLILLSSLLLVSCQKNQAPNCEIIKPVDGTIFTKGDLVSISVRAEDEEGEVTEVRLYMDEIGLTSLDFPYNYELNTGEYRSGVYTLKAEARDDEGLESTDEIKITINAIYSIVTTTEATSISHNSALAGGEVSDDGGGEVIETGIYWDTIPSPETAGKQVSMGSGTGVFSGTLSDLPHGRQIYYRAYAENSAGISHGEELSFTTHTIPTVHTRVAQSIDHASAMISGEVSSDGGEPIRETGFYWGTEPNVDSSGTRLLVEQQNGLFSTNLADLSVVTTYYFQAFAVNAAGESLGEELMFTTLGSATVNTLPVDSVQFESANLYGRVSDDGGVEVTETGFYWGTEPNAELTGTRLSVEPVDVLFSTKLEDLLQITTYYIKAFAVNAAGEVLGQEVSFTTSGPATVNTLPVESIKYTSAVISGVVSDDGGSTVSERGFYYGTSPDPVNTGTKLSLGSGLGSFTSTVSDLTPGTTYYYLAYAITAGGLFVGEESLIELFEIETGSMTDARDDMVYGTVQIGEQVWMSENLKATKYSDGTDIPFVSGDATWANNSGPAYCWYDDDPQMGDRGALYNWEVVETEKLCPSGWHVPSDQEWMQLEIYLGMDESTANDGGFRGTNEGGMLKTTTVWLGPNVGATDEVHFSALPTGRRAYQGDCAGRDESVFYWASDAAPGADPFRRHMSTNQGTISRTAAFKNSGFVVRCVKD